MGEKPRLGCAAVVMQGDKILLGRRNKDPERGKWVLPGGGVEFMESMRRTLQREIFEETGLKIEVRKQIGTYELIKEPDNHRVIVYWLADYVDGVPKPSTDISECAFFNKEQTRALVQNNETTDLVATVLKDIGWA